MNNRRAFFTLTIALFAVTFWYLSVGKQASGENNPLLMPLDDTYIHFQYARQMTQGDPFVYNPGQPATSGATSFLYTPLLAIGYLIGFHGLNLAYWAVALGVGFSLLSVWFMLRLIDDAWIGLGVGLCFVLGGPFVWATVSGMETAGFMSAVLFAWVAYRSQKPHWVVGAMLWVALMRPEGAVVALSLALVQSLSSPPNPLSNAQKQVISEGESLTQGFRRYSILPCLRGRCPQDRGGFFWLLWGAMVVSIQPLTNLLVTGSLSASGNQAKSILYNVNIPLDERLIKVGGQWLRLWRELFSTNAVDGIYFSPLITVLGVGFIVGTGWQNWSDTRARHASPLHDLSKYLVSDTFVITLWLLLLTLGVATLDTAFWHFKRYQLPIMVLLFPLAGWALIWLREKSRWVSGILLVSMLGVALYTLPEYARRYHDNIAVVQHQQLAMAQWVDANLPKDATVAVHDVGVMRYVGNRTTLDVVGLTSEGNASAWRQGPGTLYENLRHQRPDYLAIYPDVQGMALLVESGAFGEELARFTYPLPRNTVASATPTQVVTQPDWDAISAGADDIHGRYSRTITQDFELVGQINVADLTSEADANYFWWNAQIEGGFNSVVRRLPYQNCDLEPCQVVDGGRVLTGGEKFTLPNTDATHYLIILRVNAAYPAELYIGCGAEKQTKVIPSIPGNWVEIPMLLPTDDSEFCIETNGRYEPYHYWIYAGDYSPVDSTGMPIATFAGTVELLQADLAQTDTQLSLTTAWAGTSTQDGKIFVHVYTDPNQSPDAQTENWVEDVLPPANWLAGTLMQTFTIDLSALPEGEYQVAIGIYNPNTGERYLLADGSDRYVVGIIRH